MDAVFLTILNLGIKGSWLILTVFFVRLFLKRTPKRVICLLWGLALFRLICPFSVKSVFSLIPSAVVIPSDIALSHQPQIDSGIPVINDTLNPVIAETFAPDPFTSVNPLQVVVFVCRIVWLGGIAVMLVWALASWLKLKKTVRASIPAGEEVMVCDEIRAPFILGVFRPLIYVPSFLEEETADLVVRHEKAHLERGDHWWKPLGFLVLTLHWFNPLCWMAYILLCRDIESACDEKVIRDMDREQVAAYSRALLDCSYPRRMVNACPLAFGEAGVKARVTGVLRYKKPSFLITVTAVLVCLVIAVCLMTDPFSDRSLPEKLRVSLDIAAAEHNRSPYTDGHFTAVSHDVMRVSGPAGETTVYAWILYEEYSFDGTDVRVGSGSYIPCAVTFDTSADNSDTSVYPVIEYWEPRDGSYYAEDIRAKFPLSIRRKAFDASGSEALHENNVRKAREYFGAVSGNGVPDQTTWLKEKYPEYFDLPADRGLTVFVREADEEQYLCALAVTGGKEKTAEEVREMNGTSAEEMRMILSSYDISREMITVTAYSDSLPGHSFEADETLAERVQCLLFGDVRSLTVYANWTESETVLRECLNPGRLAVSSRRHLPVFRLDTKEDLEQFREWSGPVLTLERGYNEVPSFEEACAGYDGAFFREFTVVLAYVQAGSGSYRYGLKEISDAGDSVCLNVVRTNDPEAYTADMAGWLVLAEIPKRMLSGAKEFDAVLIQEK